MASPKSYNRLQIFMHWLVAVLVLLSFVIGDDLGSATRAHAAGTAGAFENAPLHVWIGTLAMIAIALRLVVRLVSSVPDLEPAPYPWAEAAAVWGHRGLWALMILAPLLGALEWFARMPWLGDAHAIASNWLMALAAVHAGAALLHHYLWHDNTLRRMLRPGA